MNALAQQDHYLNLNQFTELKKDVRANNEGANKQALQQFESLFITQMLKEMRAAAVVDEDQHSSYMDFYTDMYDKQLATIMAKQGGIGIANQLEQQMAIDAKVKHEKDYTGGKFFPLQPDVAVSNGLPLASANAPMALAKHDDNASRELKLPYNLDAIAKRHSTVSLVEPSVTMQTPVSFNILSIVPTTVNKAALFEEFHQIEKEVDNSVVELTPLDSNNTINNALVDEKIEYHAGWSKPSEFIQELMPYAQAVANQLGVKPEVLVAQSALETGWGKHTIRHQNGSVAFSLFGIKADSRWSGDTVQVSTLEFKNGYMQKEMAHFRAYDSVGEAVQDYVDFIKGGTRYQKALDNKGDDAHYVKGLQKAGYATDPAYANKILNILQGDTLQQGLASIENIREVT